MSEKGNRLQDVNYLRVFGVFMVLIIHVSSPYAYLSASSFTYKIWGSINTLCQAAVPLFLFISALTLAYSTAQREHRGEPFNTLSFYKRRLDKILLPFFCWTAIYLLYRQLTGAGIPSFSADPWNFISTILLGKGYHHLYYLVAAFQLYLIFPLAVILRNALPNRIFRNTPPTEKYILAAIILYLTAYLAQLFAYNVVFPVFPSTASTLLPYVLPIAVGLWFGFKIERLNYILAKFKIPIVIVFILLGVLDVAQGMFGKFVISSSFLILVRMTYTVFAALTFLLICRCIKEGRLVSRIMKPIAEHSFIIYLAHPLFLRIGENYLHLRELVNTPLQIVNFSCAALFSLMFALCCSLICGYLSRKAKLQRFLG